ncbi:hypothetical protein F5Y19DRAFT_483964 [Xylariaceae sp. FL1651]|nr:hypothetical protein F5Y19DRAFT_483964 [Xylariaceae sp. FL1651]
MPLTMTLPVLAPRPEAKSATLSTPRPPSALIHTDSEWLAIYPEIERMYVRERRKLRYIMHFIEREHNFKATIQMYKKRMAKWGFRKYTMRSTAAVRNSRVDDRCNKPSPPGELGSIPTFSGSNHGDDLKLVFLTSVRTWAAAFFELARTGDRCQTSQQRRSLVVQPRSVEIREMNFAFKLVTDLLDRSHGELAGRVARKAFLLVEDLLTLDGPALIWNLLEVMHSMVTLRQQQLYQMLVAHLDAWVSEKIPENHPLSTMLRSLRRLVADPMSTEPSTSSLYLALPSLLEQAWIINAEILFDYFDPELIQLYWCIFWDSCSINLPSPVVDVAVQWLNRIEALPKTSAAAKAYLTDGALMSNPFGLLHESSIKTLRERRDMIVDKGIDANGDTTALLGILAGLVTAKIVEERLPSMDDSSSIARSETEVTKVPRIQSVIVTCAIMTLADSSIDYGTADTVDRLRRIIALRECAKGETDPQVMREMWLLEDALMTAGEHEGAQEVRRESLRRLEKYVQNIPASSA